MVLQFRPPFEINPYAETPSERSLGNLNKTISGIGNDAMQYGQQNKENNIRQAVLNLQQQQANRQQKDWDAENTGTLPGPEGSAPSPSAGNFSMGSTGPMPNYSADNGQQGYASGPGPQSMSLTDQFNHWSQTGVHPEMQQPSQSSSAPFDLASYSQIPGSRNRSEYRLFQKQFGPNPMEDSEVAKNNAMAKYYLTQKGQPQSYLGAGSVTWDTATPQQQALAKAMAEGNVRPSDLSFRDKGQIVSLAQEYADKNGVPFQSYGGDIKRGISEQFSYGKPAQNVNSLNTALGHLDALNTAFHNIENTNQAWMNIPINKLKTMTNDPAVIQLDTTLNAVQGEAANVFKGGGATDQEIASWRQVFNRNLTPQQAVAVIKQTDELFRSRLDSLQYQRDNGMRGGATRGSLLSPKGSQLMNKFDSQGSNQPFTHTATGKNGEKIGFDGQNWVPIQ